MTGAAPRHRFLFLMDPYATLNLETETSLLLMGELLARGHQVFWLEGSGLHLLEDRVLGTVAAVLGVDPLRRGPAGRRPLEEFDALLVRKDPPFHQGYLQLTLLLDFLPSSLAQFNAVSALRNFNEKLLPLRWPDLAPASLVSGDASEIAGFLEEHGQIVLKPLQDCSGRGIRRLARNGSAPAGIRRYLEAQAAASPYVLAQRYLPEVAEGDKRVFLVDGEAVGWVNRRPAPGRFLANIHQGARCEATELSPFEEAAIARIAPFLKEHGVFFAGLDFIGQHLTEINITSPSAIRQINQVMNRRLEEVLVGAMLDALAGGR